MGTSNALKTLTFVEQYHENNTKNWISWIDKLLGAALEPLAGRMRPVGRVFEVPDLEIWPYLSIVIALKIIERKQN